MMQDASGRFHGYPLMEAASVASGTLYPMLGRWLERGWLTDGWEPVAESTKRRKPPRRYYELTEAGKIALGGLARRADSQVAGARLRLSRRSA